MTTDNDALRVLLEAATPAGEWKWERTMTRAGFETVAVYTPKDESVFEDRYINDANAALIVAAVNALPGLLDQIDGRRKEAEDARREERMRAEDHARAWARLAKVEALADEWEGVAGRHFAATSLRAALGSDQEAGA